MSVMVRSADTYLRGTDLAPSPVWVRWIHLILIATLVLLVVALMFAPWQQTVAGEGSVLAYNPQDRQQPIEAPISGRAQTWHVFEGQAVEAGGPLVELADIDPNRLSNLQSQLDAARSELTGYRNQEVQFELSVQNIRTVGTLSVESARAKRAQASDKVVVAAAEVTAANADLLPAQLQMDRMERLADSGAVSKRQRELAEGKLGSAEAKLGAAEAKLALARNELDQAEQDFKRAQADAEAKNNAAQAKLDDAKTKVAGSEAKVVDLESKVARQQAQLITAPRAGVVHRVAGGQGGEIVKEGDVLLVLVPSTSDRSVEVLLDGRDAPLVRPGDQVRLQFEGWPAVQFAGQPGLQHGTYAGVVAFVDPTDDGRGQFRTIIVPDPNEIEWPEPEMLRQGVRAKAWLLLDEVSIGFELWRLVNGFPLVPDRMAKDTTGTARKRVSK